MKSTGIDPSQTDGRLSIERRQFHYSVHIPERRTTEREGEVTRWQYLADTQPAVPYWNFET